MCSSKSLKKKQNKAERWESAKRASNMLGKAEATNQHHVDTHHAFQDVEFSGALESRWPKVHATKGKSDDIDHLANK
jgi:hypothetical protein